MDYRRLRILLISNHRRFKINFRAHPWARELARIGHDVDVMCHANTARFRTRTEHVDGFRIIENPDMMAGSLRQGWDPYCAFRRARFLARENKPYDIIHCLDTRLAVIWPALWYARRKNILIVSDWIDWWGRGGLIAERRPLWYRVLFGGVETWFEEHYRAKLDGLTAISAALVERAVALGCERERCIVIHGAADTETFAKPLSRNQARERLGLPLDSPVLCFSGLDVLIDLPLAVRAFELVRRKLPETMLLLVGPTEQLARGLVSDLKAFGSIRALGPIPYRQLPDVLPAADVFLMPFPNKIANVGRWPNKAGDFMCVGRPVVSNPVGEVKWLFDRYELGELAQETAESMADATLRLLGDPERAAMIGRNARAVAEREFGVDKHVARLNEWYSSVLSSMEK